MFDIEYKGGNAVLITTKKSTLYLDPKLSIVRLSDPKLKNDVQVATEERFLVEASTAKLTVRGPGEYEVGEFTIKGTAARRHIDTEADVKKSTIYRIECEGVRIGVLGNIDPTLDDDQQEAIGVIDILILPVGGGGYTLDATAATALVRQLDPKVVIPVHYADGALRYEVPQATLDTFTKELGAPVETVGKYRVKSSAALPASLTLIEVTRS